MRETILTTHLNGNIILAKEIRANIQFPWALKMKSKLIFHYLWKNEMINMPLWKRSSLEICIDNEIKSKPDSSNELKIFYYMKQHKINFFEINCKCNSKQPTVYLLCSNGLFSWLQWLKMMKSVTNDVIVWPKMTILRSLQPCESPNLA